MSRKKSVRVGDQEFTVVVNPDGEVLVNGVPRLVDMQSVDGASLYSVIVEGESYGVFVDEVDGSYTVDMGEASFTVDIEDEGTSGRRRVEDAIASPDAPVFVKAPMPGLVVEVRVQEGRPVAQGEVLLVLESMKMQNELRAPAAGVVESVEAQADDRVEQHQVLLRIGPAVPPPLRFT
jgi:biotin carboxyl carrier protein